MTADAISPGNAVEDDVRGAVWSPGPTTDAPSDALVDLELDLDDPRVALVLAIADDELVTGHRTSHWTGVAPSLEEDIAFSGISQDEINHADVLYQYLTDGKREQVDRLGLGRRPDEYRHAVLCEHPPGDFAYTLARQLLYDHADVLRLDALRESSDSELAAIARKLLHEERYHIEHADTWFWRMAGAGGGARDRLEAALRRALPDALWLFEPTPGEDDAVASGLLPTPMLALLPRWLDVVGAMLDEADLADALPDGVTQTEVGDWRLPDDLFATPGGRHGVHTADFAEDAWPEMTAMYRAHPNATW